jgi:hypothetical protein
MMSTDCHSVTNKKKTRRRIWRLWSGRERLVAPPQGRHAPRLASAGPGLGWVAGLMRPGGTGTAPIIGRRCWWPPQVAQVRR